MKLFSYYSLSTTIKSMTIVVETIIRCWNTVVIECHISMQMLHHSSHFKTELDIGLRKGAILLQQSMFQRAFSILSSDIQYIQNVLLESILIHSGNRVITSTVQCHLQAVDLCMTRDNILSGTKMPRTEFWKQNILRLILHCIHHVKSLIKGQTRYQI